MSHPQPKRPSSDELINLYSVAGTKKDAFGNRVNTPNREEGLRQVRKYR